MWGLWEQNVGLKQLVQDSYILCWAAKWFGENNVIQASRSKDDEATMLAGMHKLLDEADAVVHYNGKRFDIPWLNGAFVKNGMMPPSPYKQIDLVETVKRQFRFPSNKLAYVTKAFGLEQKIDTNFDLWLGCIADDPKAWKEMERYNANDVVIMEQVYVKVLPWIKGHANHSLYSNSNAPVCPNCGSNHIVRRGVTHTLASVFQRYRCSDCGHWSKDNVILNRKQYKTTSIQ